MDFLDSLRSEHEVIERVALSLRSFVRADELNAADARDYVRFLTLFAGAWHHEREEEVLFPLLTGELLLPSDRGPVAVLIEDHHRMAELLAAMRDAVASDHALDAAGFRTTSLEYTQSLLLHIDAENSVLLPECEDRLRRAGIRELSSRELTGVEIDALATGRALAERYPPELHDVDLVRGEGCAMCPSYGLTCSGVEREWWNEWQWEEFDEHIAAS